MSFDRSAQPRRWSLDRHDNYRRAGRSSPDACSRSASEFLVMVEGMVPASDRKNCQKSSLADSCLDWPKNAVGASQSRQDSHDRTLGIRLPTLTAGSVRPLVWRVTSKNEAFSLGGRPPVVKRSSKVTGKGVRSVVSKRRPSSAIRIADLERELAEAHERQGATATVLQAISQSNFDLTSVLQTLVSTAARLCRTGPAQIFRRDGDVYRFAVSQNATAAYSEIEKQDEVRPGRGTVMGRALAEKRPVQIRDALEDAEYDEKEAARAGNLRTMIA